jgi:hypothetical protein
MCCLSHDQSSPSFTTFVVSYFDCSPNNFWNALCVNLVVFINVQIFSYLERSTRIALMKLNAIANFSLWWYKWKNFSSSSTSCRTSFIQGAYPTPYISPNNLLQFRMNFNHLGVVLIIYYKYMHLVIHFNLGATCLFLHTSFFPLLCIDVW